MAKKNKTKDIDDNFSFIEKPIEKIIYGANHILAIAIDEYDSIRKLSNCKKDVEDILKIMTTKYTYSKDNVKTLYDEQATSENILAALDAYSNVLKPEDTLTILFSGHGENRNDIGFWIPVNATINKYNEYLSLSTVCDFLEPIQARHIFVVADACFSGLLFKKSTRSLDNSRCSGERPFPLCVDRRTKSESFRWDAGRKLPFCRVIQKATFREQR